MTRHGARSVRWGWLAAGGLLACTSASAPVVGEVTVTNLETHGVLPWTAEQLKGRFAARLAESRFATSGKDPWRLALQVEVEEPRADRSPQGSAAGVLTANQPSTRASFQLKAFEQRAARSGQVHELEEASQDALDALLVRLAQEARATIELSSRSDEAVVKALSADAPATRAAAVRVLVARRHPAALEPILEELKPEELSRLRGALGLLVELKDPRAAPAIIEASRGQPPQVQLEILWVLSALGGEEAQAYLYTVSQGHDDPLLRDSASRALAELSQAAAIRRRDGGLER